LFFFSTLQQQFPLSQCIGDNMFSRETGTTLSWETGRPAKHYCNSQQNIKPTAGKDGGEVKLEKLPAAARFE